MPTQIAHQPSFRSGTLTIRIFSGDYIDLPPLAVSWPFAQASRSLFDGNLLTQFST